MSTLSLRAGSTAMAYIHREWRHLLMTHAEGPIDEFKGSAS